jgi:hypothetical protein
MAGTPSAAAWLHRGGQGGTRSSAVGGSRQRRFPDPEQDLANALKMEAPGRVELPTNGLGNRCSIHLSYGAKGLGISDLVH